MIRLTKPQSEIWQSDKRFKVVVCGRRFGKTYLALPWLCHNAMTMGGVHYYIAPSYVMARQIAWRLLKEIAKDWIVYKNESLLCAELEGGGICVCFKSDYSYVLDGYHPEPEKEPEPKFYNGKVVCVSSGDECFTVGKMYEFVNGEIKDDEGDARPVCTDEQFKSVEEWNEAFGGPIARFIEFKGEAK